MRERRAERQRDETINSLILQARSQPRGSPTASSASFVGLLFLAFVLGGTSERKQGGGGLKSAATFLLG